MKRYLALIFFLFPSALLYPLELASPFGEHMVLQRDTPLPIWGRAEPRERITVSFADQTVSTQADTNGSWKLELSPLSVSTQPRPFRVTGNNSQDAIQLNNILVGDVWLCGGQSNMERQLGPRPGQPDLYNWQSEVARANYPQIRELYVKQTISSTPATEVEANWRVCSPDTAKDFTAVGYYFARDLHISQDVPIGIIHSSWGGTPAQSWTSRNGLSDFPHYTAESKRLERFAEDPVGASAAYQAELEKWFKKHDIGSRKKWWQESSSQKWDQMNLPTLWEESGHEGVDGIAWFTKSFELPDTWEKQALVLELGAIDDIDTTWINGQKLGTTSGYRTLRRYEIAPSQLNSESNTISVRVLDTGGGGGIWNSDTPLRVSLKNDPSQTIDLAGPWAYRFSQTFTQGPRPPVDTSSSPGAATSLFNGMIAPLVPYAIRGVAFYQGEANAGGPAEYEKLLPALIEDWRSLWNLGDFPFLFVQIAPFNGMPPEIREAQRLAQLATPNTAMAVTLDIGDAVDIHPANKEPVGQRLALAARALAYGEAIVYSGPAPVTAKVQGKQTVINFENTADRLVAPGEKLIGFEIAGEDGNYQVASARIEGTSVILENPSVPNPRFIRYAWANVPNGNLYNSAGLPASPFEMDMAD